MLWLEDSHRLAVVASRNLGFAVSITVLVNGLDDR